MAELPIPAAISWSGGKDSAFAHYIAQSSGHFKVQAMITTISQPQDRISMHGVRASLLTAQAHALELPLTIVNINSPSSNEDYERAFLEGLAALEQNGIETVIFGDLFLPDVRAYRERLMARSRLDCAFPLWNSNSRNLAFQMLDAGFQAIVCTVDPDQISPSFCGRDFNTRFISELPASADPCGENGEFHTFVTHAPTFSRPVLVERGAVVERDGFWFCDLLPVPRAAGGTVP